METSIDRAMARGTRVVDQRLVLVTELFPPAHGGTPVLFHNIYSRLPGADVTVLTHGAAGQPSDGPLKVLRIPMREPEWGVSTVRSVRRHLRVIAQLRTQWRQGARVLHCARALPEGLGALAAARICPSLKFLVWTHGEELQYARSSRELTLLLRRVHAGAAAILANSYNTARELEALGVPVSKVHVVYPGVDAQRFGGHGTAGDIRGRYASRGELLLLTVGRLQRRKGHDLTIEALARLKDDLPDARYLIVGDGEERARLEALVDQCGVRDRVHFTGAVDGNDLPSYFAAADVFVHPNRIEQGDVEGFGIVFLEAAAAGLPVIGGTTGGAPEAIEKDRTGLLVSGTDVNELAAAIRTLAGSDLMRRRMGMEGRERVVREFTWERAAAGVMEIQRRLAA